MSNAQPGDPIQGAVAEGTLLWEPSEEFVKGSALTRYADFLRERYGLNFAGYAELWHWSVTEIEQFWQSVWEFLGVRARPEAEAVLEERRMPGAVWFPGSQLNYAEHALARRDDKVAVIYRSDAGLREQLSYRALAERVARVRAGLRRLGVAPGDRVAAYLPNAPEALICLLATASLGAIWSSCPPEFGAESVLDRFRQIEPKVLIGVDGYHYGGKFYDRREALEQIRAGLPGLAHTVVVPRHEAFAPGQGQLSFDELSKEYEPLAFEAVAFDHPLWVLYSSGTTGLPKAMVHGHGGILLEHFKQLNLQSDIQETDRFFWFSTTGWMMWNYLISGLVLGSTITLYEGNPGYPDLMSLWRMAAEERITYFGTSAPFLIACRRAGLAPGKELDLSALRGIGSTGAPLPAEAFVWAYENVSRNILLGSVSGGTDLCTGFVVSCPWLAVHAGELQCLALGAKVEAFDEQGHGVIDEVGELVITEPMPSMPIYFWNDPDYQRYNESYFDVYPGVWRHGDWIKITPRGSAVIYGRSDSTLNRGGVRMGTSEFYRVVESCEAIKDSVVVDTGRLGGEDKLWLFVVLAPGHELDADTLAALKQMLRTRLSPRHVPYEIRAVEDIPYTLSGKKLEVPIKRILTGTPIEKAANPGTLRNPQSIYDLVRAARQAHGS